MAVAAAAFLSACVTDEDSYGNDTSIITHTHHSITARDRAMVQSTFETRLRIKGLQFKRLEASEHLESGAVTLCGYVSGISPAGTRSPDSVFGGVFSNDGRHFTLFGGGGQGQDPGRIQRVKMMCGIAGIYL